MPNLSEIEKKIDETLASETPESLNNWLNKVSWISHNKKTDMKITVHTKIVLTIKTRKWGEFKFDMIHKDMDSQEFKDEFDMNYCLTVKHGIESIKFEEVEGKPEPLTPEQLKYIENPEFKSGDHVEISMEFYTEKDLISFGKYMVSKERKKRYKNHPEFPNNDRLKERLREVNHADLCNWKEKEGYDA